jgi:hypothetical protein
VEVQLAACGSVPPLNVQESMRVPYIVVFSSIPLMSTKLHDGTAIPTPDDEQTLGSPAA